QEGGAPGGRRGEPNGVPFPLAYVNQWLELDHGLPCFLYGQEGCGEASPGRGCRGSPLPENSGTCLTGSKATQKPSETWAQEGGALSQFNLVKAGERYPPPHWRVSPQGEEELWFPLPSSVSLCIAFLRQLIKG